MRKTIAIVAAAICLSVPAHSQTFLDHLQKDDKGNGSVSVKQSDDISKLVNGNKKEGGSQQDQPKAREDNSRQESAPRRESSSASQSDQSRRDRVSSREDEAADKERREREKKRREAARAKKMKEFEENATVSDSRMKLMSNSRKVMGYRVQVFAGGNTRVDRAKAQEIGAKLKTQVPGYPIYVHFYSPRWCCRFGNFRKQDDASEMVKKMKKLGYKTACVIKTSITVGR
ncbi:MAG: SPOR domain-containing protein [Prevotella sp.]|nr:SPOR domain-containing protein [Prevotella sp.]